MSDATVYTPGAFSNATWDGSWDSGDADFQGLPLYNPNAPVDYAHQDLELFIICLCDALAFCVIVGRTYMRKKKLNSLRADDWWMISAGLLLALIWWPCQIAANRLGSGLHWKNVTEVDKKNFWIATWGFSGYYIISSIIKISICFCHINLLPPNFTIFRRSIKGLCVVIMLLGLAETALWNFNCQPFASNFIWTVPGETCINLDIPRATWVGMSVLIDIIILLIPFKILQNTKLSDAEKKALMFVFSANLLGTATCLIGIYGIWQNRWSRVLQDSIFSETVWLILNNIEVLMYTLGASFPVLSPYFVARASGRTQSKRLPRLALSSWFPSFRRTQGSNAQSYGSSNSYEKTMSKESIISHPIPLSSMTREEANRPTKMEIKVTTAFDCESQPGNI